MPIIPRELLVGTPERAWPLLSPDGRKLGWLAPDERGVPQVWVRTLGGQDDAPVTAEKRRGPASWRWTADSSGVLYTVDGDGDERFHVWLVDLASKNVRDLTPVVGLRAELLAVSPRVPDAVLVTANLRDRRLVDVYRVSLRTGALELDTQNPGDVVRWYTDSQLVVRGASALTREGATELRVRDSARSPWRALVTASLEEQLTLIDFTEDGRSVVVASSIDADTQRVVEKSLKTGAERLLAASDTSDPLGTLLQPVKKGLRAVAFDVNGRLSWTPLEYGVRADFDGLNTVLAGSDWKVLGGDDADTKWVVAELRDAAAPRFWLWDRRAKKGELLFSSRPRLDAFPLAPSAPISLSARDGLVLRGFLTRPLGASTAGPLVVLVHGGPWARDGWGFDGTVQLLANRGYTVLQVNFRGSTGAGKRLLNAGNRQWGLKQHDDVLDAVGWAVQQGVADPKRVAVMGTGYGGYEALVALTSSPQTFACGVSWGGWANLFTVLHGLPPEAAAQRPLLAARVGNADDLADAELLTQASPSFALEQLKGPVLLGQGANDPGLKPVDLDQLVGPLEKRGVAVSSVLYADEGRALARGEDRQDFLARAEALLAGCLKGRAEPPPKDGKVAGASAQLRSKRP